jgi:hypothetical protein
MALADSGEISFSDINTELGRSSDAELSLSDAAQGNVAVINTNSANTPDSSTPHSISEWYSYNHSASGGLTEFHASDMAPDSSFACGFSDFNFAYWHNGGEVYPEVGNQVYIDSSGGDGAQAMPGWYKTSIGSIYELDGLGVVTQQGSCGRSERRLKYNIEFIGDSPMGIPMYHFNYKNKKDGVGRFVGTMVDDLQRLGFEDALIYGDDAIYVNYSKIDVPFKLVK